MYVYIFLVQAVYMELKQQPQPSIKLLYVTPEQLVNGMRLKNVLKDLNNRVRNEKMETEQPQCFFNDLNPISLLSINIIISTIALFINLYFRVYWLGLWLMRLIVLVNGAMISARSINK